MCKEQLQNEAPKSFESSKRPKTCWGSIKADISWSTPSRKVPKECVIPYSDAFFRQTALEWLIETDQVSFYLFHSSSFIYHTNQPIQALDHSKFKEMISVASRATHGITIPNHKATQKYVINLFKKNLTNLQSRLMVICHLHFFFSVNLTSASLEQWNWAY